MSSKMRMRLQASSKEVEEIMASKVRLLTARKQEEEVMQVSSVSPDEKLLANKRKTGRIAIPTALEL